MENTGRPDPDLLLKQMKAKEEREKRARLKIFFGYAPGVGKTFAMLQSAARLRAQGVDVAVGTVETHGRKETEVLLSGLEILPRNRVSYRGVTLEEFDLTHALLRKPKVILLDELAHTNAPGSRHKKRVQDVLDLLKAGIEVHTTLNVQHVESLNDVISQITSIRVRETVPDSILERADEIELVDISPAELLERMRSGKVYLPEQAARAVDSFFRVGNLSALRELALRRTAERVDADVRAYREENDIKTTWPSAERILVCVGPSPSSAKLIRGARRMAAGLRAPWVAVSVEARNAYPMNREDRHRLQAHLRLAESLGAEAVRLSGDRVSEEILKYARAHNVTRMVIGKPSHSRWRDLIKGSLINELVRESGDIEIHFIQGDESNPTFMKQKPVSLPQRRSALGGLLFAFGVVGIVTLLSWFLKNVLSQTDIVMLYLTAIMTAAFRFGRRSSIATSTLSVAAFDFFFVPPFFTFRVADLTHVFTFAMMFGVGLIISAFTSRLRRQRRDATRRESRTASLYAFSRDLATSGREDRVAEVIAVHAAQIFGGDAFVLRNTEDGSLSIDGKSREDLAIGNELFAAARWVVEHALSAGRGTDTLAGLPFTFFPIQIGATVIGVLGLKAASAELVETEHRAFLEAFVRQAALSMERARLTEETKSAAVKIRTEETRSALLSAVSHDLRTPLGAITGAGTALRDDPGRLGPEQRTELLDTICTEAERMDRLIGNILDMVRLESGGIVPKCEWIPLEEIVGAALSRLEAKLGQRKVVVDLPPTLPFVFVDPVLFGQVLINLLENAIKYGAADAPIEVAARSFNGTVEIEVADRGPGLPVFAEERVFEKFFRGSDVHVGGAGLGLAICRGIVIAHGGSISAENRQGGGALFRIGLPKVDPPTPAEPFENPPSTMRGETR